MAHTPPRFILVTNPTYSLHTMPEDIQECMRALITQHGSALTKDPLDFKSVIGPYYSPCKSYTVYFYFFHWLPNCPDTNIVSYYAHFGHVINLILCLLVFIYYASWCPLNKTQHLCLCIIHLFFKKKDWAKGRPQKKLDNILYCLQ